MAQMIRQWDNEYDAQAVAYEVLRTGGYIDVAVEVTVTGPACGEEKHAPRYYWVSAARWGYPSVRLALCDDGTFTRP